MFSCEGRFLSAAHDDFGGGQGEDSCKLVVEGHVSSVHLASRITFLLVSVALNRRLPAPLFQRPATSWPLLRRPASAAADNGSRQLGWMTPGHDQRDSMLG